MIEATFIVPNKSGLHTRTAHKLVTATMGFQSSVQIGNEEKMVDAKSILSLMLLEATQGSELTVVIDGPDEDEALKAILELVDNRFGED